MKTVNPWRTRNCVKIDVFRKSRFVTIIVKPIAIFARETSFRVSMVSKNNLTPFFRWDQTSVQNLAH